MALSAEGHPGRGIRVGDGQELGSGDFEGGKTGAVTVLDKLGFDVRKKARPAK
jgi:hypothetical protein